MHKVSPRDGLVEFKNPYSFKELAVSDAIVANMRDRLDIYNGLTIRLKHTHIYYYQLQMMMFCKML